MVTVITTRPRSRPPSWNPETKSHKRPGATKFVAIDGEGMTFPDGTHRYVLIRIGTNPPLVNPNGLHWSAIFEYLYSYHEPRTAYVGFYLGYDYTQMFRTMRENRARKLLTREGIASRASYVPHRPPLPVEADGWQFDMLSGRRLRIRPKICHCPKSHCECKPKPPWMYICDAGGFFQTSFLVAINPKKWPEPIVSPDEYAVILQGKDHRPDCQGLDCTLLPPGHMQEYNRLENEIMARLMARTDEGLRRLGVSLSPKEWFSPAQAAQKWMSGRVPTRQTIEEIVPKWYRDAARASYFGGWFEIFMHGPIPRIVYQYDINSAYPTHAYTLPCLLHGNWSQGQGSPNSGGGYVLVRADVSVPVGHSHGHTKKYIGAMPHRTEQGKICRPQATSGWYWLHEIRAAERAGVCRVMNWHEWVRYDPCPCPSPLRELKDLYLERKRQKKDSPLGRAARLVYNCVYGKLCQNVGDPKFMNFVYSSLITAGCRIQILDAIATHPVGKSHVVQVATDAVYFLSPHPGLKETDELGDWGVTLHHNLTVFKPGVYWDDKAREMIAAGDTPQFKARGVSARDMASRLEDIDRQFKVWNGRKPPRMHSPLGGLLKDSGWPSTKFKPSFAMVTALQALIRKNWALAGTLLDNEVRQSSNPGDKRQDAYYDREYGVYRSEPRRLVPISRIKEFGYPQSQPYEDKFGKANPTNWTSDERQDEYGISPDGMVDMLTMDAMMPDRKWAQDVW